ncbi:Similar to Pal1: Peptidyl-alpha-hydroxyglycine alpha-amidating lyase 1 (Drosophila melanogaster) [Cotesia congregata]|uniref:peptidylamidoglycolate lyase n=1 Tax=Cotesia congregata TaxID=51543 RepID=A0A8J2MIF4_COTCN|nr:Similar to Pal1: Peptidyl-alpha-hydroxyglycine alpha-amidating lyase 1 (Drosophila melanogaster) [Cotesia congregata]
MTHIRVGSLRCILILLTTTLVANGDLQNFIELQHRRKHLPDTKFGSDDYAELLDNNEPEVAESDPNWSKIPVRDVELYPNKPLISESIQTNQRSTFESDIKWDKNWTPELNYGQLSGVDLDPNGNIVIFSRREIVWGQDTFDYGNKFNRAYGPIKHNTIIILDKNGKVILEWGKNMFYLPHGLTIDHNGNYWLTDVGLHQVFKFDGKDIKNNWEFLKNIQDKSEPDNSAPINDQNLFNNSIIKPTLILGEAFVPGNDNERFCKPTSVAVANNGDFFVSDGYCNSRIIKFNSRGERILTIGRILIMSSYFMSPYAFSVPHALALDDDMNYLYVADREHGRVLCYYAQNGTFHKEFKNSVIGTKIYSIAYARQHLYIVNGADPFSYTKFHIRGFVIDVNSGDVVAEFGPNNDMLGPHDIAVSDDGSEIYVIELNSNAIYRFLQDVHPNRSVRINSSQTTKSTDSAATGHHNFVPLTSDNLSDKLSTHMSLSILILTIIVSVMIFIGLCVGVAAVVARCQKRGCLLSVRKRGYWANDSKDNFKLSSLLNTRQNKNFRIFDKRPSTRDFSKLNTEPETTDDEHVEDNLII